MSSGPTQNYGDPDLGRWRPHPVLAAVVRIAILVLPVALVLGFGLAAAHWFPASRLGVNRWVWVAGEVTASLLLLAGSTRLARELLPLSGLLKLTLYFPDRAPSRLAVALRHHSPDALRSRTSGTGHGRLSQEQDHAGWLLDTVAAIMAHDSLTAGHSERVQAYAVLVGKELGLSSQDIAKLSWAALLHDVGKLTVPAEIIAKKGRPTDAEWARLATHPHAGREIAAPLADWLGPWLDAIDQHHERWDGGGYPRGLAGTQISLAGRIVAVVDAYDVITSARAYKAPLSAAAAREELARCAGSQFDPEIVRAMLAVGLGRLRVVAGPMSVLSAVPGLGSTPLAGLTSVSSTITAATGAVAATVLGATVGLVGPGALPSDAATRAAEQDVVASDVRAEPVSPATTPDADAPTPTPTPTPSAPEPIPGSTPTEIPADEDASSEPAADDPAEPSSPPVSTAPEPGASSAPGSTPSPQATTTAPKATTPAPSAAPVQESAKSTAPVTGTACAVLQSGSTALPGTDLQNCDLSGLTLTGELAGLDLRGADLTGATLTKVNLTGANLTGAVLTGATISSATLDGAVLQGANLRRATISKTSMVGADLRGADLSYGRLSEVSLAESDLRGVTAVFTVFDRVGIQDATTTLGSLFTKFLEG